MSVKLKSVLNKQHFSVDTFLIHNDQHRAWHALDHGVEWSESLESSKTNEAGHSISNNNAHASGEHSDQPAHPRSLIAVFVVRLKTFCTQSAMQRR